ncbi:hypothetical protein [Streptomyces sp. CBMA123]|uniref:hypothetical protein n=1 Tax=Streptomyces sp. CBMA123 TaxID=1896313 RepID=UPI001661A99B|nr:hypothetical protein [Streptomyces sp. CBMA123]MBD0694270.1 hypothetical protein [Streptomyces sp. CBMA123]
MTATAEADAAVPDEDDRQEAPPEEPQNAYEAVQELLEHVPDSFAGRNYLFAGGDPSFGGNLVGGDEHVVSGGQVHGDVVTGHKTTVYQLGAAFGAPLHASGEVPAEELDALDKVFRPGPHFHEAVCVLEEQRVLILTGRADTGRRSAALMLLRGTGADRIRNLDPDVSPTALLTGAEPSQGYLLTDYTPSRTRPLLRSDLDRLREILAKQDGYLVITTIRSDAIRELPTVDWQPPDPRDVLFRHVARLRQLALTPLVDELLALDPVRVFLAQNRPMREIAEFAGALAAYSSTTDQPSDIAKFGHGIIQDQVGRWFGDDGLHLREKAFLISLAVFDHAPYTLAAECADKLFRRLETIRTPGRPDGIPPFGSSIEERMALARAELTEETEQTPWGPVPQRMASFQDPRTSPTLLREVWTSHPSARPAITGWLNALATDSRALVRARVASTTALLASVDLSATMSGLLGPWSGAKDFRLCLQAANSLALAYHAGTAAVPRILRGWAGDDSARRRWTAIRCYALLGPLLPAQALEAFALAAERLSAEELDQLAARFQLDPHAPEQPDRFQVLGLLEAAELLLLSAEAEQALRALVRWLSGSGQLRQLALATFLTAARRTEDGALGRPLLLDWYARSPRPEPGGVVSVTLLPGPEESAPVRSLLVALWRTALDDRLYRDAALGVLRGWLTGAADQPETTARLTELFDDLAVTERDRQRLDHLVRTVRRGPTGGPAAPALPGG